MRKVNAKNMTQPYAIINNHIEAIKERLFEEIEIPENVLKKPDLPKPGFWKNIKTTASDKLEPIYQKKEEIIISIVIKLLRGYIERKMIKFL